MGDKQNETQTTRRRNWGDPPLDDKQDEPGLKWYHHRPRFTGELVGGLIAGFGMGMATALVQEWPYPIYALLIFSGVSIAHYYQLKRDDEQRNSHR